jgi:heme/copper-type cytochrome/quinol oxidase subunit 4
MNKRNNKRYQIISNIIMGVIISLLLAGIIWFMFFGTAFGS